MRNLLNSFTEVANRQRETGETEKKDETEKVIDDDQQSLIPRRWPSNGQEGDQLVMYPEKGAHDRPPMVF